MEALAIDALKSLINHGPLGVALLIVCGGSYLLIKKQFTIHEGLQKTFSDAMTKVVETVGNRLDKIDGHLVEIEDRLDHMGRGGRADDNSGPKKGTP
jgi:hypothetical protein